MCEVLKDTSQKDNPWGTTDGDTKESNGKSGDNQMYFDLAFLAMMECLPMLKRVKSAQLRLL